MNKMVDTDASTILIYYKAITILSIIYTQLIITIVRVIY